MKNKGEKKNISYSFVMKTKAQALPTGRRTSAGLLNFDISFSVHSLFASICGLLFIDILFDLD